MTPEVVAQGATPLPLDGTDQIWLVVAGAVDVFAMLPGGGRRHVFSAEAGDLLPPIAGGAGASLVAVGLGATQLQPLQAADLPAHAAAVDRVVRVLAAAFAPSAHAVLHALLESGTETTLAADRRAGVRERVAWVRHLEGASRLFGTAVSAEDGLVPLQGLTLTTTAASTLEVVDTETALSRGAGATGLRFLAAALRLSLVADLAAQETATTHRLQLRAATDARTWQGALTALADLLAPDGPPPAPATTARDAALAACRVVGQAAGINFREPPRWETDKAKDTLPAICRASHVRSRRVALRAGWWTHDAGPLLAYRAEGGAPVALLSSTPGAYVAVDPAAGTREPVTPEIAATLEPFAVTFYRPLPGDARTLRDLFVYVAPLLRADAGRIAVAALASGLLALVIPVATAQIFNQVIPNARSRDLLTLFAALVASAIGTALFDVTRAFALTRSEGRVAGALQAALVDRLLALPVPFFRKYAVGDLSQRASAVQQLQDTISTVALTTMLTSAFAVVNIGVLVFYDWQLAGMAVALLAVAFTVYATLLGASMRLERAHQEVQGRVAGLVFQMISGIGKLRVSASEGRVFAVWARSFAEQRALAHRAGVWRAALNVFNDVLPVTCSATLYAVAGWMLFRRDHTFATGDFVAFNSAFGALFAAGAALSNTVGTLVAAVPILERARPIVATAPEVAERMGDPGALRGHIEGLHLSFRYQPDGPMVLDDVSFEAKPGQFVAFVGPSGSGKSTTLRLLLGFEAPETGTVYYDGQDLASLDISAIRNHQIGVVLQTSRLLSGDIFTNIVGTTTLTQDDAWEAAEAAGLADDIRDMPMGMHTMISEGGTTLSGGQRQRLLIARALVRKPRIILFDEATSALDNRTQETVTRTLELSNATRFVIAHRLSTIRRADRIYVMEHGRVVEQGDFDELARGSGLFARLIARQRA